MDNIRVGHVSLKASAKGTPTSPVLEAQVASADIAAAGYRFSQLNAEIEGGLDAAKVSVAGIGVQSPDVAFHTDISLRDGIGLKDSLVQVRRGAKKLTAKVESVRVEGTNIDATGVVLEGAGEPLEAAFSSHAGRIRVKAKSPGLDLATVGYLAGKDKVSGKLALDVALDARRDRANGKVELTLTKGELANVHGAEARIGLDMAGRSLKGAIHAAVGNTGSVDVRDVDVHMGGEGPLAIDSWRNAWGSLSISADVDLARAAALVPGGLGQVSDISGRFVLNGTVRRDSLSDVTPDVQISAWTSGLSASGQSTPPVREPGGPLMVGPAPWTLNGVDLGADLLVDGEDGTGEFAARLVDSLGALIGVDVKTGALPFAGIFVGAPRGNVISDLERLPASVIVDVPKRNLATLPLIVRPDGIKGFVEAEMLASGNAMIPDVDIAVRTSGLTLAAAPRTPVHGSVHGHYDGTAGQLDVDVASPTNPLLKLQAKGHIKTSELLVNGSKNLAWGASMTSEMTRFPLQAISFLADERIRGFVSGKASITNLHDDARADVHLTLDELHMAKTSIPKGAIDIDYDGHALQAHAKLDATDGALEAKAELGMTWGKEVAPALDGTGLEASLSAKHFAAGSFAPFASARREQSLGVDRRGCHHHAGQVAEACT